MTNYSQPKYPIYIISKGRADSRLTSKTLDELNVPYHIVIEKDEYDAYAENIHPSKILTLPDGFREDPELALGDAAGRVGGSIPARNFVWQHAISTGAKRHWIMDDNIRHFYRVHQNKKTIVTNGNVIRACEEFTDRFTNVAMSGMNYQYFVPASQKKRPYTLNTRVYSCILLRNDLPHRWRGRYNEDTDICLRVMKDGDVCLQFNAFMQGKMATQTVAGGNTAEFYHAENTEAMNDKGYNTDGTINKSQMLADMHPDVARVVWRYGRWHHHVNYNPFKKNKLVLKDGLNLPKSTNTYGMILDRNFNGQ